MPTLRPPGCRRPYPPPAAVEHARLLRPFAESLGEPPPDQPADAVRLRAGGRPSRADGPDGLVGYHKEVSDGRIEPGGAPSPLPRDHLFRAAGVAPAQRLPHAGNPQALV